MKKRLWIVVLALCVLLLLPHTASANSPAPDPTRMKIEMKRVPDGTVVTVMIQNEDGEMREDGPYTIQNDSSVVFYTEDGDSSFCIVYSTEGCDIASNWVSLTPQGTYEFDYKTGTLKDRTDRARFLNGLAYLPLILTLTGGRIVLALATTLLIEFLTGLCFGMKPFRYILIANLITNPAMNIVLLFVRLITGISDMWYWVLLAALEVLAVFLEILFYRRKYRGRHSTKRIVAFAITANALSLAAGVALYLWLY